jgi:DNA-binding NtrC family response regulator
MKHLQGYDWPGNVRELRSCMERGSIYAARSGRTTIAVEDLPLEVTHNKRGGGSAQAAPRAGMDISEDVARHELSLVAAALKQCNGRRGEAAKLLGYSDRFAMRRRILSALRKYPGLAAEFPTVTPRAGQSP